MLEPIYTTFKANDGEELVYQSHGHFDKISNNTILILIHGFTGSSQYFIRNFADLAREHMVIAPDLRGHGKSTKARHGYHVARLAADLRDLLELQLRPNYPGADYVGVGCSLGAAVLWTYSELFDSKHFAGMVFVDQAPLQDYIPDSWSSSQGNYGVHDSTSLAMAQATLKFEPDEFYKGLVQGCLGYRFQPLEQEKNISNAEAQEDEGFFVNISKQGNSWWFGKLLANHTSYDHRDTIKNLVKCPSMVLAAKRSGSFPVEGLLETIRLVNEGKGMNLAVGKVVDSGHCRSLSLHCC
jgi:pimeloyl-ACP methyl ester carboxylesterase